MAKEYIPREAALELLKDDDRCGYLSSGDILSIPAADVVEVVRCKDCKYHKDTSIKMYAYCCPIGQTVLKDDYCSYGERRDNNG